MSESDISRFQGFRAEIASDGVVVFVDPGTRITKKNRHRRAKDGAPKSMRGKPKE